VITETVFAWPGIGLLVVESIQRRDYPVVQACVLFISIAYVLVNTLTDLVYAQVDRAYGSANSHERAAAVCGHAVGLGGAGARRALVRPAP